MEKIAVVAPMPSAKVSTAVSAQCEYGVGANADRPAGTVTVHVDEPNAMLVDQSGEPQECRQVPATGALQGVQDHVLPKVLGEVPRRACCYHVHPEWVPTQPVGDRYQRPLGPATSQRICDQGDVGDRLGACHRPHDSTSTRSSLVANDSSESC